MRDSDIQCTAELTWWARAVQYQSIAVDQQAQLIGVVVVLAIESDVEITDNVYRLVEDGNSIEDGGQLVEKRRTWIIHLGYKH